jgi:hypothetical protein
MLIKVWQIFSDQPDLPCLAVERAQSYESTTTLGGTTMKRAIAYLAAAAVAVSVPMTANAANDGKNRRVTVENLSSQSIYYLYASPQTSSDWEEDLLGSGTIPSGSSKVANIDNGTNECIYDLKVKLADGKEYIQWKVNVCAVSTWTVGDSGNSIR